MAAQHCTGCGDGPGCKQCATLIDVRKSGTNVSVSRLSSIHSVHMDEVHGTQPGNHVHTATCSCVSRLQQKKGLPDTGTSHPVVDSLFMWQAHQQAGDPCIVTNPHASGQKP